LSVRAGRRKCRPATSVVLVCTGDFGTSARHPPRERIVRPIRNSVTAGGHNGPPLHGDFAAAKPASSVTTTHSRAGGHGGPPLRGGVETRFQRHQCKVSASSGARYSPEAGIHIRPEGSFNCEWRKNRGVLVEAGGEYRAQPNGIHRCNAFPCGRAQRPSPTRNWSTSPKPHPTHEPTDPPTSRLTYVKPLSVPVASANFSTSTPIF